MKEIIQYINETFGIDNETSAPIIITLLTFLLSYILVGLGQSFKKYRDAKNISNVFEAAVIGLIQQMNNQSKNFTITSENLVFKNDLGFSFRRVQLFPINTFENIGYSKTVEIYILRKWFVNFFRKSKRTNKSKALNKLWEVLHSATYWHEKAVKDTSIFLESYNNFNDRRNDAVEEHNKFFLEMIDSVSQKQIPLELVDYIEKAVQIRQTWVNQTKRTQPDILNDYLIQPLRALNRSVPNNPIANQMNFTLLRADHEFTNQKNVLIFYQKQYADYSTIFRNYSRIAERCLKIVKGNC
jgi:hypothetical protein